MGTNAYWLPYLNSDADIQATLANMSKAGITVVRTWAFNGMNQHPTHLFVFPAILILKSNRRHQNSSNGQLVTTYPERYHSNQHRCQWYPTFGQVDSVCKDEQHLCALFLDQQLVPVCESSEPQTVTTQLAF